LEEVMKLIFRVIGVILVLMMAGCANVEALQPAVPTSDMVAIEPTPEPTLEPTVEPTIELTPVVVFDAERQRIRALMEEYGWVDEKLLSDAYWERIASGIEKYGSAKRIMSLEYHGDNYFMYDGAYSMTPEQFEIQMRYLLDNEYHFVTGIELVGFLEGWLDLPARSIILTTDSGEASYKSIPRIIALYTKLENEYGVAPHMNSFIWTMGMAESENGRCANDACWQFFRNALYSGYFSFGNHTQTHRDFRTLSDEEIIWDIETSKQKIFDNLGLKVFGITWPLEECSKSYDVLKSLGVKYAFGGSTRELNKLFTYANDDLPLCLPRLFPPNPNGVSGRPNNKTLFEMLEEAMIEIPLN